jgi:hypothetical protein
VIDEVWHAHILDTVSYMRDTTKLFGAYLHHTASAQPQGEGTPDHDTFLKAGALYASMFREDRSEELWGAPTPHDSLTGNGRKRIRPITSSPRVELNCGPPPVSGVCGYDKHPTDSTAFTAKAWVLQNVTAATYIQNVKGTSEYDQYVNQNAAGISERTDYVAALVSTLQISADGSATMICTSGCDGGGSGVQTIKLVGNFSVLATDKLNEGTFPGCTLIHPG